MRDGNEIVYRDKKAHIMKSNEDIDSYWTRKIDYNQKTDTEKEIYLTALWSSRSTIYFIKSRMQTLPVCLVSNSKQYKASILIKYIAFSIILYSDIHICQS